MDQHLPAEGPVADVFSGFWEDGRPKSWPTVQVRVRGRPFDIYCDDRTDVTLDGKGLPVVCGVTVSREELSRGWYATPTKCPPAA
jgi:hypothetical protein